MVSSIRRRSLLSGVRVRSRHNVLELLNDATARVMADGAKALADPTRLTLVTSRRDGKMVMYAVTESGRALLSAVLDSSELAR
jgi:hypothetical protein